MTGRIVTMAISGLLCAEPLPPRVKSDVDKELTIEILASVAVVINDGGYDFVFIGGDQKRIQMTSAKIQIS